MTVLEASNYTYLGPTRDHISRITETIFISWDPPPGFVKINTDETVNQDGLAGATIIIRDRNKVWIADTSRNSLELVLQWLSYGLFLMVYPCVGIRVSSM